MWFIFVIYKIERREILTVFFYQPMPVGRPSANQYLPRLLFHTNQIFPFHFKQINALGLTTSEFLVWLIK